MARDVTQATLDDLCVQCGEPLDTCTCDCCDVCGQLLGIGVCSCYPTAEEEAVGPCWRWSCPS